MPAASAIGMTVKARWLEAGPCGTPLPRSAIQSMFDNLFAYCYLV